jgi:MoxR-like ATPase
MESQKKVREIYDFIDENLYLNRPDIEIRGEKLNSTVLFTLLTGLNRGKELILGEPGLGKTTSAEYAGSLLYRYPLAIIWSSEVPGHPEQTEEKIVGRPDLGKINRGIEEVVWSNFSQLPVKIVDEINRLPETKQSMILDGIDRGNWGYLNEILINEEYCLFATANYQDRGTNTIIAPLLDRFDIVVESKHPGPNLSFIIADNNKENILRNPLYEKRLEKVLKSKISYERKLPQIEEICEQFGVYLKKEFGIDTIHHDERRKIESEIRRLDFDMDASAFTIMFLAELSFCFKYGQKRSNEVCEEGCHYSGYLCHEVRNCASNRLPSSIKSYAQSIAWLWGRSEVDLEEVKTVIPYTIAHRVQWKDDFIVKREKNKRNDPLQIYLAKEAVNEVFHRYYEQKEDIKRAFAVGYRIINGEDLEPVEGDHPVYAEIKNDIMRLKKLKRSGDVGEEPF